MKEDKDIEEIILEYDSIVSANYNKRMDFNKFLENRGKIKEKIKALLIHKDIYRIT